MPTLNNNQIYTLVRQAYTQTLGGNALATEALDNFTDEGDVNASILTIKEQWTNALINVCAKNWFTDTSYRSEYNDPFFEDEREYGALIQLISATVPEAQQSHAWQTFTSGVSTAGQYTLFMPVVESKIYGKTVSWEIPIAVTDEQLDDAFRNADELAQFVSYIMLCVDNALVCHLENMTEMNRNNFIAEKIVADTNSVPGVHVVNLLTAYNTERGGNITSVVDFLSDPDALRYAAATIDEYSSYFSRMSKMFNVDSKPRFTPDDRKVIQIVKKFAKAVREVALSGTFNAQFVELPGYQEVPFWQAFGQSISWADVTTINATVGDDGTGTPHTVNKSSIVALIVDKWAIMHTIRSHRVAVTRFDPEAVTQYYYQFRDSYANDLSQNGVVFIIAP